MSKKDYVLIASSLKSVFENSQGMDSYTYETLVTRLALGLEAENTRFDRVRFLEACGLHVHKWEKVNGSLSVCKCGMTIDAVGNKEF